MSEPPDRPAGGDAEPDDTEPDAAAPDTEAPADRPDETTAAGDDVPDVADESDSTATEPDDPPSVTDDEPADSEDDGPAAEAPADATDEEPDEDAAADEEPADATDEEPDEEPADGEDGGPAPEAAEAPAADQPADSEEPTDDEPAEQVAAATATEERPSRAQRRGAHARKVTPQERLRELIAPQANRTQALIAVACLILGFALSVQAKSTAQESSFASLRQSELVGLLDRLNKRQEDLRKEVTRLEQEKAALESDDSQTARKAAQQRQHTLAILAGTEPATGPGIELVVSDPDDGVTASDLLNAVQELRDAGAEVLQIGSVRLAVDSYFTDGKDGVLVDGRQLTAPYRIKAIGDPHTLATAMDIPGGVLESLHRAGGDGTVTRSQSVAVTAVRKS